MLTPSEAALSLVARMEQAARDILLIGDCLGIILNDEDLYASRRRLDDAENHLNKVRAVIVLQLYDDGVLIPSSE